MAALAERARAKVNLTLHVLRRRADGWHELDSLVAFAGVADALTLAPDDGLTLSIEGATAADAGASGDNLVLKAASNLADLVPGLRMGAFHLVKRLPVAAGMGGGSADAAAALRLLARANAIAPDDARLHGAARATGADVPVCLASRARVMRGTGAELGPVIALPPLYGVLVNPGVGVATQGVFARMGLKPGEENLPAPKGEIAAKPEFETLLAALKKGRNDMEDAAIVLAPAISAVLAVLGAARGCRLARMSGSGATCFALFQTRQAARRAAQVVRRGHPGWWVAATLLW